MDNSNHVEVTGRHFRYALAFAVVGGVGIVFGAMMGLVGAPLIWFGATMMAIGGNYAYPRRIRVFHKTDGKQSILRKLILFPYISLLYGTWHLLRLTSEAPFIELAPGILIGRRLLPHEYPAIATLVDLTAEFDEHVPEGARLLAFPILDGAPAEPVKLQELAQQIAASARLTYIHCAQGHGRTSMVAAAVLIELGIARSVPDALERIRMVRPGAKPNKEQLRALMAAFSNPSAEQA